MISLRWFVLTPIVLSTLACGLARAEEPEGFHLKEGVLYRGESSFQVRAFADLDALSRGDSVAVIAPALARAAEVGGDAIVASLPGLTTDGRSLAPDAVKRVQAWADRAKDTRMALVVRLPIDNLDEASKKAAVKTSAKALKNITHALYCIPGDETGDLSRAFKKYAPNCVVASASGGDIIEVMDWPLQQMYKGVPYMLLGKLPPAPDENLHFVLDGSEESRKQLEAFMTTEVEKGYQGIDPIVLDNAERKEGFVPLFNGRDLSNWWVYGDNPNGFHVSECGEIEWQEGGASGLISAKRYGDFILRLEYKLIPGGNSGIYLRAPRAGRQSKIGMEFQLHGDAGAPVSDDGTGAVYTVVPPLVNAAKPGLEWNKLEITLQGDHLHAVLNGQVVQELDLKQGEELPHRLRRGFIGLQDHDNYVAFRNIRIKEL